MVGAVPEHGRGRSDPRAQKWSGQYPSTVVVCAVPEHISGLGSIHDHLRCLYYYFVYFSLFSAKASLTRLVKKVNRYSTSFCLLFFFCKQSVDTCIEVCQCGPPYTVNEEARTLLMK